MLSPMSISRYYELEAEEYARKVGEALLQLVLRCPFHAL